MDEVGKKILSVARTELRKVILNLRRKRKIAKWRYEVTKVRIENLCKVRPTHHAPIGDDILILIPHPDDEWVGCSGLISDPQYNVTLVNMNMSKQDDAAMMSKRQMELQNVANRFDRNLISISENKVEELQKLISVHVSAVICVPFFFDWNDSHIEMLEILRQAIEDVQSQQIKVLMYQVSCPIPPETVDYVIPFTKAQYKQKWDIFGALYATQYEIIYPRFAYQEQINGSIFGAYSCEVFAYASIPEWKNMFNLVLDQSEKEMIRNSLNDLVKVRRVLDNLYSKKLSTTGGCNNNDEVK